VPFILAAVYRPPLALGIHFGHDAAVSICAPTGILFSLQEERVSRIKHHFGFPRLSLQIALDRRYLEPAEIKVVAFSSSQVLFPDRPHAWIVEAEGDRIAAPPPSIAHAVRFERMREKVRRTWNGFADRHWCEQIDFLNDAGVLSRDVAHYYVNHHRAHAASAFRLSGFTDPAAVLTCDGKGDGLSATIYRGDPDGRLTYLRGSTPDNSVGMFYQAITEALGFVPVDGEYKTMGLAAFGENGSRPNPFAGLVSVRDGVLSSQRQWTAANYNDRHPDQRVNNPLSSVVQADEFRALLETMPDRDLAFFAQAHFEEVMTALASDAMRLAGSSHLAAAGGVMLNVKANALIRDRLDPASFFVYPDSADGGLAAGAAMEALYQEGHVRGPVAFGDPYLGHGFSDESITADLRRWSGMHPLVIERATAESIAAKLAGGKVIGTFQGRLEMGPRALGNRSVLADPRRLDVKEKINALLKGREPFVPFAPSVLEEDASLYWDGSTGYRYMTFAVTARAAAREQIPAVVHVDGTLRPQVVSDVWNPRYAGLLRAFKQMTGVGVLLNTSFNRHGHPIVGSPDDALMHLINGWVEGLYIGTQYVELRK
jgi:carbamoyltransferase